MFSLQIVDSDAFLEMPQTSQLLYFHLSMRADDDGFVGNPRKILRMVGANEDDFKILLAKRFILSFESGVVVIKHWKIHNYIAKDRYRESQYRDEKKLITTKDNGSYTECIQNVDKLDTQVRLGKDRIGKVKNASTSGAVPPKSSKNPIDDQTPYTLEEFIKSMGESTNRHMQIIGDYADQLKPAYTTKGQWHVFIQRNVRSARLLSPYTDDQIAEAFNQIEQNIKSDKNPKGYITKWTLETLLDFMHK